VTGIEQVIEDLYILENLGLACKNARLFRWSRYSSCTLMMDGLLISP
jgi:hypothetical protein